ncbi:hypothetical protein Leryth_025670 [Lithospermum erythrorhizon]|nr:hypothetical protein Leryth_025670 [Lithospermum erythrorhizon]
MVTKALSDIRSDNTPQALGCSRPQVAILVYNQDHEPAQSQNTSRSLISTPVSQLDQEDPKKAHTQ